ncbi:sigma-B regulation protein RsbU (phosphoserine phosphatase) [Neolewinella xylanilytica]|uniref:Sigma-B regulation protein RsbU (Phosphoserine phosphatase) n=1 Tax=Neolewinella xylanilytica TaxID=1514080 RepID=A0A2S6I2N3_9BACT|nr:SpoIIE family protein phosphatase [Neolewinella xylanilytica]PPK85437.1 sigma-B regulation protein RsbU (phosphoserine phosphatase) [Neolewinella xylanilytica]
MSQPITRVNRLERELHLRQLQVRRLLQMTQAINNNVSAEDLFQMYRAFLRQELGVNEMALFVRENDRDEEWRLAISLGLDNVELPEGTDYSQELMDLKRAVNIDEPDHPLFRHFEHVVPVLHKERPIAFILIGSFSDEDDMYERVQIITTISNVIAVAIENKRLFRRQLEQERLEADLDLGAKVQHMLIPKDLPANDFYELSAIYRPKLGVGGDYFDFREFTDGKLVFCIGDFTGKGVSAALLMANFQANFHTLIRKRTDLHDFVAEINESVYRITNGERFVTFFVAEYDRVAHQLRYVNAGHPPAVLVSENSFQLLDKGTTVLGSIETLPMLEVGVVDLPPQALIVTYTDGLTDLQSVAGEMFEEEILHQFARRQYYRSAQVFNENLLARLEDFRQEMSYPDDLTILTCRIFGE